MLKLTTKSTSYSKPLMRCTLVGFPLLKVDK
jgi:hypothetical protein